MGLRSHMGLRLRFGKLADFFFFCPGCFDCASDLKALGSGLLLL